MERRRRYDGGVVHPSCAKVTWNMALGASTLALSASFALGYLKQPAFLTRYAGGQLFHQSAYLHGLKWGLITAPILPVVTLAATVVPCLFPVICLWSCTQGLAAGNCCGSNNQAAQLTVTDAIFQLAGKVLSTAILFGIQGYLMRKKIYPWHASAACGFTAGAALLFVPLSICLALVQQQPRRRL